MSTHANPNLSLIFKEINDGEEELQQRGLGGAEKKTDTTVTGRLERLEASLEKFYGFRLWNPRFMQSLVLMLGLALVGGSIWATVQFFKIPKPVEPVYTKIEGIKRLGELHLVKQHYESIIPITRQKLNRKDELKREKLQFLLRAPVEVSGYMDFSQIKLVLQPDSLVEISLPPAEISDPYLDFNKTEEYLVEGKFRIFGQYIENINHEKAYYDIARGINDAKEKVKKRAISNEILKETHQKAQIFLRNFVHTLGYRVSFITEEENTPVELIPTGTDL